MNNENLEWFWHWIRTRENVRIMKERGEPGPWCNDPIIANNHFCNVRREDDRGTKEIRDVVLASGIGTAELPWVYTMARMFNHAPAVRVALTAWLDGMDWAKVVRQYRDTGAKIFNTAYVVSTCGRSMDKVDYVAEVVAEVSRATIPKGSLARAHSRMMEISGLGSFLAGQVVADLKNDRYLASAEDWYTWSAIGPGSRKGLKYIWPESADRDYENLIGDLYKLMPKDIANMRIHAQDLQNCLCEFSKYMMLKEGTRKRSRPYGGKTQ